MTHHLATLDPDACRHVLGVMGEEGGYQPGGFTTKLVQAIAHADPDNRALLAEVYPELVAAVSVYQLEAGGLERMRRVARLT